MDLFATPRMKAAVAGVTALVLALVAVIVVLLVHSTGASTNASAAASSVPKGYTTTVTVPTVAPNVPKPAIARPSVAPPKIFATGACAQAMDSLRGLMGKYPSGLALDAAGNAQLTSGIAGVNKACDTKLATEFQQQELMPWMNYAVPTK